MARGASLSGRALAFEGFAAASPRPSLAPLAGPTAIPRGTANLLAGFAFAYIATLGLEAAIRWLLNLAGADAAIYVKDLLPMSACVIAIRQGILRHVDSRLTAGLAWVFLWLGFVGIAADLPIEQVLFGAKVWIPFAVGFVLVDSGAIAALNRPRLWSALWLLLCAGILLNYFFRTPWAGLTAQIGDANVEINRDWTTYGTRRLSGFSRSSYDGAIIVLLLHVYLMSAWRSGWVRAFLVIVSTGTIAATTSKGALGALLCTFIVLPVLWTRPQWMPLLRVPALLLLVVFAAVGLFAPLLSTQFIAPIFTPHSVEAKLFASLADRGWETWPAAFDLLKDWQVALGRGIGGIGAAQYQFEPAFACPADNMFVFLFVTGGVLGAAFYVSIVVLSFRLALERQAERLVFMFVVAIYSYGMTASIIDNSPLALALGGASAALMCRRAKPAEPEPQPLVTPERSPTRSSTRSPTR
jgi:O-Antigen ligase